MCREAAHTVTYPSARKVVRLSHAMTGCGYIRERGHAREVGEERSQQTNHVIIKRKRASNVRVVTFMSWWRCVTHRGKRPGQAAGQNHDGSGHEQSLHCGFPSATTPAQIL